MTDIKQPKLYALLSKWLEESRDVEVDPDLDAQRLELEREPVRFREIDDEEEKQKAPGQ